MGDWAYWSYTWPPGHGLVYEPLVLCIEGNILSKPNYIYNPIGGRGGGCKLRAYRLIKHNVTVCEPYLTMITNPKTCSALAKFQLSDHKLQLVCTVLCCTCTVMFPSRRRDLGPWEQLNLPMKSFCWGQGPFWLWPVMNIILYRPSHNWLVQLSSDSEQTISKVFDTIGRQYGLAKCFVTCPIANLKQLQQARFTLKSPIGW